VFFFRKCLDQETPFQPLFRTFDFIPVQVVVFYFISISEGAIAQRMKLQFDAGYDACGAVS
jgi:hypothetical protein